MKTVCIPFFCVHNLPIFGSLYRLYIRGQLSVNPQTITKIALTVFAVLAALFIRYTLDHLRQRVTVISLEGESYSTHMSNINGLYHKVIFNGFGASGAEAEGTFLQGLLNGEGKIHFPAGAVIQEEGVFYNGWLLQGKMTYRDGSVEEGCFKDGMLDGSGRRTPLGALAEEGFFKKGCLCD